MIRILDKHKCCGCAACIQRCPRQCITMQEDSEGFGYPVADPAACIHCGLCEKVCPVLNPSETKQPLGVYAAINPNEEIRRGSSSGGIFTLLAEKVIADGGVVFGARFDEHWEVVHDYCDTPDGLAAFRGSKYVQSRIGECYRQTETFLKAGRKVLFSGTSCQIAGLHRFLGKEYAGLLTVDIVCHGVPSPSVWREYVTAIHTRPQEIIGKNTALHSPDKNPTITGIAFRDKSAGWRKYRFAVRGTDENEPQDNPERIIFRETFYENLFMGGFLKDIYLRPSCYACPAKGGKAESDITLGDYWGIENHHPEMDDDKGTSMVAVHTAKGEEAFRALTCKSEISTYEQALEGNPSMEEPVAEPPLRRYFYRHLTPGNSPETIRKVLRKTKPSWTVRIKFKLKLILKTISK